MPFQEKLQIPYQEALGLSVSLDAFSRSPKHLIFLVDTGIPGIAYSNCGIIMNVVVLYDTDASSAKVT